MSSFRWSPRAGHATRIRFATQQRTSCSYHIHQAARNCSSFRTVSGTSRFLFALCLLLQFMTPSAFVYVDNSTYPSLPALFGRYLAEGKIYDARLQYFHDNPYLCDMDEKTAQHFVPPVGPSLPVYGGGNITLYGEPVALLVVRGNCPFQRKAAVAESLHESVKFLVIANFNLDNTPEEEDTLVPMYSQFGNTRLVLLSISHSTGQVLKKFLSEQPAEVTAIGGPIIRFDAEPPMGLLTAEDLQSMMLSALGLFFMLISFTGCLVILAGTFHQIANNQLDGSISIGITATQRRLLTEEEVQQLTAATADVETPNPNSHAAPAGVAVPSAAPSISAATGLGNGDSSYNNVHREDLDEEAEEDQCAVCLGDFDESSVTALPCHHKFHTSCITPWLTERQSKCPLCKFDVLQHIREQHQQPENGNNADGSSSPNASASVWDQLRRHRWTSVRVVEDDREQTDGDGVMRLGNDLRLEEDPGVELTERRPIS